MQLTGFSGWLLIQELMWICLSATEQVAKWQDLAEYCQWETFEANCKSDEVIVMKRSIYGRMKYGRCIRRDYGYVGCYTDVLSLADTRCSGRQSCQITVPDKLFDGTVPCPEDLKLYLMADYVCVKVALPKSGRCIASIPSYYSSSAQLPNPMLSSWLTTETGCGSPLTPWIIEAQPGQKINLTLIDFAMASVNNSNAASGHCHVYASVKETKVGRSETICGIAVPPRPTTASMSVPPSAAETAAEIGFGERREKHAYLSTGHTVEIRFMTSGKTGQYLLKYDVVGCPDFVPAYNGWWKRQDEDSASSGCGLQDSPDTVWQWTCRNNRWVGDGNLPLENCTNSYTNQETYYAAKQLSTLTHVTALIIITSLAAAIGLLMLVVGVCIIKRRRAALMTRNSVVTSTHGPDGYASHSEPGGVGLLRAGLPLGPTSSGMCTTGYILSGTGSPRFGRQHQLQQPSSYSSEKEHAASCCSGSDGNDYAYVEDLLYAAASFGPSGNGQGPVCSSSTLRTAKPPYQSSFPPTAWCPPPPPTGRLHSKDIGTTATYSGSGSGRAAQQML